jgi:hypothetical protein
VYLAIRNVFGLITSDSLLNPSHKTSSLMSCSSQELSDRGTESQQSLHHFIDDRPKTQYDRLIVSKPELDVQSNITQLSISIPMASSDFISSTSSSALSQGYFPVSISHTTHPRAQILEFSKVFLSLKKPLPVLFHL